MIILKDLSIIKRSEKSVTLTLIAFAFFPLTFRASFTPQLRIGLLYFQLLSVDQKLKIDQSNKKDPT